MSEHDKKHEEAIDLMEEFESEPDLPEQATGEFSIEEEVQEEVDNVEPVFSPSEELAAEEEEVIDESAGAARRLSEELLKVAPDVPVSLVAVIGKVKSNVAELISLKQGSVIDLKRPPNETVDLVANGKLVARGELVEMDGKLGVRIIKLVR